MHPAEYEKWLTAQHASRVSGIPTWKIYQAIRTKLIPIHTFGNSRRYVRLSDIDRVMQTTGESNV